MKLAALGLGSLSFRPRLGPFRLPDFPQAERLGRVVSGKAVLKARPDWDSPDTGELNEDDVVPWLREVAGSRPMWLSQRFVETPGGFLYAANVQPVRNLPNPPLKALPPGGVWVEVTVPYVDLVLANPPARAPWLKVAQRPRLYYSQIMFVDELKTDEQGQIWYRVSEKYGTYGDIFWAQAEAFRPLTAEDISPISPDVTEKQVRVNVTYQTMACYEGNAEVFFCRVSTGGKYNEVGAPVDKWSTPVGTHRIWRKLVSVHMSGGSTGGGYDLPGIGWTTLFSTNGVAVHSTFWHNNYGVPMSHGCVNSRPEDARWVFRWTLPDTPYDTGDITVAGRESTRVVVVEA